MSVFPDGSKIKTEVPVRNRRSRCRESARNNSEAQRWHSQLPPTEIELLELTLSFLSTGMLDLLKSNTLQKKKNHQIWFTVGEK